MTQKKKTEESWVSATAKALYADTVAKNTPRGTLGRKHTEQIALRYALQSRAIYRWNLFKKFLLITGVIGLVLIVISNWP
jgi:hypothetical protein